jgi:high affinity sulfate transporter 1
MVISENKSSPIWKQHLANIAPGLPKLLAYQRADLPRDLVAGLSVAAVALPVGVAYAQLAGFRPEVGLYASILPLLAYAIFGTSRQLIVGPDAAVCALLAAAVGPLAGGDPHLYASLAVALTFFAGLFCIAASFLRLGAAADFLSQPILVGFLNGVALSIALGQLGKIFGFPIASGGIVPRLIEFVSKLRLIHWPTLAVGFATFGVLAGSPRLFRRLPAALLAMIATGAMVKLFGLEAVGIKTVGAVAGGWPPIRVPRLPAGLWPDVLAEAVGLALISFSSLMLTAGSFAAKNHYDINPDREFAALGVANIASAISQGFAISGADSRTAMNDASGGRTQVAGVIAAAAIAAVLMFFTGPLRYIPVAALGAVLVRAAWSLVDVRTLQELYRVDRREFVLSVIATLGVVAVGAVQAILVAVLLAIVRFVRLMSRPKVEILGTINHRAGFHSIERHRDARTTAGLLLFRFNAPIVFFNAPYFKREAMAAAEAAGPELKWFVIDMIPVPMIDVTGLYAAEEVVSTLASRGVMFATAGRQTEWNTWIQRSNRKLQDEAVRSFPTLRAAYKSYLLENPRKLERSA